MALPPRIRTPRPERNGQPAVVPQLGRPEVGLPASGTATMDDEMGPVPQDDLTLEGIAAGEPEREPSLSELMGLGLAPEESPSPEEFDLTGRRRGACT